MNDVPTIQPPSWNSPEFWLSIVKTVFALLVTTGMLSVSDMHTLQGAATAGVTAVFSLIAVAYTFAQYFQRYGAEKQAFMAHVLELRKLIRGG